MRILNDDTKYIVICNQCSTKLEVEESDLQIGSYGEKYCECPCCNNEISDGQFGYVKITEDNFEYPKFFYHFKGGAQIDDEDITYKAKLLLKNLKCGEYDIWSLGDTFIFVEKDKYEDVKIVVAKNYQELSICKD